MRRLQFVALAVMVTASACVSGASADPEYAQPSPADELGQSQGPTYDEFEEKSQPSYSQPYAGPPGGEMDAEWQYQNGAAPDDNGGVAVDPNAVDTANGDAHYGAVGADGTYDPNAIDPYAEQAPVADPAPTANVNDAEIDATLQPYGEWVESAEYGLVWRPYTTVVGADFTPYETCGQWVWTDYGWTFSCDWTWGWLPFHYGSWVFADNSWCWTRGYEWSPAWVDWRSGGDYIGWRPRPPHGRPSHVGHWSYGGAKDFGRGRIRRHWVDRRRAEQTTSEVPRPPVRGGRPIHVAGVMGGRRFSKFHQGRPDFGRPSPSPRPDHGTRPDGARPGFNAQRPDHVRPTPTPTQPGYNPRPGFDGQRPDSRPGFNGQRPDYGVSPQPRPDHGMRPTGPRPGFNAQRPDYQRPSPSYGVRPSPGNTQRPSFGGMRPRDNGPSNVAPSRPSYSPPSRPSSSDYARPSAPSRPSYSPPSRSSSSYSPPSRPSSSSSSSSRPSSSYSPSRSSSSSSHSTPSRSSSSFSAPSRSSGGHSGGGGGGGRRR